MPSTSSWLTTAASALICASALSKAYAFSIPSLAEELKTDIKGNLIWNDNLEESSEIPSLQRPDFSKSALQPSSIDSLLQSLNEHHPEVEKEFKLHLNKLDQVWKVGKKKTEKWISQGLVEIDGMKCE